jgi:hypothetical protein
MLNSKLANTGTVLGVTVDQPSTIENQFCELHNKFKRFSNNNSTLKTDDYKYVNLQIKVSFLLKNIRLFTEDSNTITQDHHKV